MILLALGFEGRIEDSQPQGEIADFVVRTKSGEVEMVDKNQPKDAGHFWGHPVVRISSESDAYSVTFVRFFDWDELARREFEFLEVKINRMEDHPELSGHALVEMERCSLYVSGALDHGL